MIVETVSSYFDAADAAAPGDVVDISDVACHPAEACVAVTLAVAKSSVRDVVHRVAVVDAIDGSMRLLAPGYASARGSAWSPDGRSLSVITTGKDGRCQVIVVDPDVTDGSVLASCSTDGVVERVEWDTIGRSLGMLVAGVGAEISDVYGSGVVGGQAAGNGWQPMVSPGTPGRRSLMTWSPQQPAQVVSDLNVWEFSWAGADGVLAVVSDEAGEGSWYAARLVQIRLDGSEQVLYRPDRQISCPRWSPSAGRWSVIEGLASDRGVLAGSIVIGGDDDGVRRLDVAGAHVTDHHWSGPDVVTFAGLRGLDTVVGDVAMSSGRVDVRWSGPESTGRYIPEVASGPATGAVIVLEDAGTPPSLTALTQSPPRKLLKCGSLGMSWAASASGTVERLRWVGASTWEVEGLLTLPPGTGPHPLVVNVHGGPVSAWRDSWCGRDPHTSSLVARGYAVLRPNPRGSIGRGREFTEAIQHDMGGADVEDILAGVYACTSRDDIDGSRVGITGNSYGGFMAAWMPAQTEVFRASVSRSPVTDWLTQHLTTNIAAFDALFLEGDPFELTSQYRTRSPLVSHGSIRTPMLLTAGALDLATPASQAQLMHAALRESGVPTTLVIYPEEGHGVREREALVDQCSRMVCWFDDHLRPTR